MELLLVRHGIAFERSVRRWADDCERALSPRGVVRARQAAAGLSHLAERPQRVLTSPLVRTAQTAKILATDAGWPPAVSCALLAPGGSPERLLALLAGLRAARVAVVGHEPDLGRLLAACLGDAPGAGFRFKKMGAALVKFPAGARAARGTLVWFLPPRVLRTAR